MFSDTILIPPRSGMWPPCVRLVPSQRIPRDGQHPFLAAGRRRHWSGAGRSFLRLTGTGYRSAISLDRSIVAIGWARPVFAYARAADPQGVDLMLSTPLQI